MSIFRPDGALDARFELFYDGRYNAIPHEDTRSALARDGGVSIGRGRPNESGQTPPTSGGLAIGNDHGRYTRLNPASDLWGKLHQNTRLRVSIGEPHVGTGASDPTPSTDHVAPSVTAAKAGRLICAWFGGAGTINGPDNYTVPPSMTLGEETSGDWRTMASAHEVVGAGDTGTRTSTIPVAEPFTTASVVLNGDSTTVEETLSAVVQEADTTVTTAAGTQAGWWLVAIQAWRIFPQARTRFMPAAPNDDEGGWILLADSGINKIDSFDHHQVRIWARRVKNTGAQEIRFFGNIPSFQDDNNENHAHLYVLSGVDDWWVRLVTEVPSWAPTSDAAESDIWLPIEGGGILRRLEQGGQKPLESPIRSLITSPLIASLDPGPGEGTLVPVAYWPLEDATDSTQATAGFVGGQPMSVTGGTIEFAAADGPAGSDRLPNMLDSTGRLVGTVTGLEPTSNWVVGFPIMFEDTNLWPAVELSLAGGPYPRLQVQFSDVIELFGIDDSGSTNEGTLARDLSDGRWYWFELDASTVAGTVFWAVRIAAEDGTFVAGALNGTVTIGSTPGTETGPITQVTARPRGSGTSASIGHITVWRGSEQEPRNLVIQALDGYRNEPAGRRLDRLADLKMIPFHPIGNLDDTARMGPQPIDTFVNVARECEAADHGILHEPRQEFGLGYRTRTSLYNQAVLLPLDYRGEGELVKPLQPVDDDQQTRNDITVTRAGGTGTGSSAQAVDEDGPKGVNTVGRYDFPFEVNVASDPDLPGQAGHLLLLGTVNEYRYPTITLDLLSMAEFEKFDLLARAAALDVGDRLTVGDTPPWLPPEDIDQLALGFAETLAEFGWEITTNNTPASPYTVGVWAGEGETPAPDAPSRQSPLSSTVSQPFNVGVDTQLQVADLTGGNDLWSENADHPFDLKVRGIRQRCTAVGPMVLDTFSRTVGSGWGTSDSGHVWTVEQISGTTTTSVAAGEGHIDTSSGGNAYVVLDGLELADVELVVAVTFSIASGFAGVVARTQDGNPGDNYGVVISSLGDLEIYRNQGGPTLLASTPLAGWAPGAPWWLRVRLHGTAILATAWPVGTTKPGSWMVGATDAAHATGALGCQRTAPSGEAAFEDFQVVNPQVLTVEKTPINGQDGRLNGVLIAIGEPVKLWTPARVGL